MYNLTTTLNNLIVYEVIIRDYDTTYQYTETIDSEYVLVDKDTSFNTIIKTAHPTTNFNQVLVQVYEQDLSDFKVSLNSGGIELSMIEATTTGGPVYEAFYNNKGKVFNPN